MVLKKTQNIARDNYRNQIIPKRLASVRESDVQPVFLNQEDAIDYATGRVCFRLQTPSNVTLLCICVKAA
ncbi:MAG: hypothetical protein DME93_04785 [Verrucomicrobia bacterium]|nr:MAG: hypothetical protein DME93_04785 [Verrucomicrobiota bacterium]